jgi:hypothetical protein
MTSHRSARSVKQNLRILIPIFAVAMGSGWLYQGCGYRPVGVTSAPARIQRLHLGTVANETFRPGVQGMVGAALLRRLQSDGRLRLAPEADADAVLAGTVKAYQNDPIAFERADIGRRFRVRLSLAWTVTERKGNRVLLTEEIVGEAFYTAGAGVVATRAAEEEAALRAAQDLAARVVWRLLEEP